MRESYSWWQKGIIYQIYPRSFKDSNGDGVGDLPGIISEIDYLQWLGVDAVWLSPIYPSPMKDFGYDISDYRNIDPIFGTLEDFDQLVRELHQRDIRIILDFVPNHSSDQHPWFFESKSSTTNPKRNWYIWKDPAPDGGPPNNWLSVFGGPAWHLDATTGQYYYHAFLREQPDLNWRNPEVQEAMFDNMRFWLDRGVDGFRVDVIWHIIKDDQFRDNPHNPTYEPHMAPHRQQISTFNTDRPEVHEIIEKMRHVLDSYPDRMMVGEIYLPVERLMTYYGSEGRGAHLPFNFQLIHVAWNARDIANLVETYEAALPPFGWPNWVLGNHDNPRVASRIGTDQLRVAGMLLLTLRGTPILYYADELGLRDVHIPPEMVRDPFEKNVPGMGHGRDPERTPMPWNSSPNAGFTEGTPWLPLNEDWETNNVEKQTRDPRSVLNFYRRLIAARREHGALAIGRYRKLWADDGLFAYLREDDEETFLIALNFFDQVQDLNVGERRGEIRLSTELDREGEKIGPQVRLRPNEGLLMRILA